MTHEERLNDLLLQWEELFDRGQDLLAEELCPDHPDLAAELAGRIAVLKRMDWINQSPGSGGGSDPPAESGLLPGVLCNGAYRLVRRLGKGGFGEVWEASTGGGRHFALKFVEGGQGDFRYERELEGFKYIAAREVRNVAILDVIAAFPWGKWLVLVTELADASLEDEFNHLPAHWTDHHRYDYAVLLLERIAGALDSLSLSSGLMHLDVKPSNLLLFSNVCKLADFGSVRRMLPGRSSADEVVLVVPSADGTAGAQTVSYRSCNQVPWGKVLQKGATLFTASGAFTLHYAPPEAFRGKFSRSSDQYSLALTFCELAAGATPFRGREEALVREREEGALETGFLPEPLRPVLRRALSPLPEDRFPTCSKFINSLRDALGPPIPEVAKRREERRASQQSLDLVSWHLVTDEGLAHLKGLTSLQSLNLACCSEMTDAGLAHLKGLTSMQSLNLSFGTKVTDAGLAHLGRLTSLQSLNLGGCPITGAGLAHLRELTSLCTLDLSYCPITDAGLAHLKGLTSLRGLDLSGCRLTHAGLAHLKGMNSLQGLGLRNCHRLTHAGLAHLRALTSLQVLDLSQNPWLTDTGVSHLEHLTSLQTLDLAGSQVTDAGLARLSRQLPQCHIGTKGRPDGCIHIDSHGRVDSGVSTSPRRVKVLMI